METIKANQRVQLVKEEKLLEAGETFEVTNERAEEISKAGYASIVEAKKTTVKKAPTKKAPAKKVVEKTEGE